MKTFKSNYLGQSHQELNIVRLDDGVRVSVDHGSHGAMGIVIAPSDAPALALAILEAAGVEPSSPHYGLNDSPEWNARWASHYLGRIIELTEAKTAEAKEQAELEAEALELYNARILFLGGEALTSFEKLNQDNKDMWLAVARRAREMRAEK